MTETAGSEVDSRDAEPANAIASNAVEVNDPRQDLSDFAMQFVDVRYRLGGRAPSTGFDCSGFVHYVFAQVLGIDLPQNSMGQYQVGKQVARTDMMTGDLVFFKTHGKRISHVGIYLGEGRFIHSPTTGERVRVDNLSSQYWAHRFAGARRPATFI
jgi:cell wall-associated NlpC family hydrolase